MFWSLSLGTAKLFNISACGEGEAATVSVFVSEAEELAEPELPQAARIEEAMRAAEPARKFLRVSMADFLSNLVF